MTLNSNAYRVRQTLCTNKPPFNLYPDSCAKCTQGMWSDIEVYFDVMLQNGEHLATFIDYARNPRIMSRLQDRMKNYGNHPPHVSKTRSCAGISPLLITNIATLLLCRLFLEQHASYGLDER